MANLEGFYIPRTLDEPGKILFWSFDEGLMIVAPVGLGIILGHIFLGMLVGCGLFSVWKKLKGSNQANYMLCIGYWYLPVGFFKLKKTPPSYQRIFRR